MQPSRDDTAVVVFSGGQDSTVCLGLARQLHRHVHTLTLAYGQRHRVEVEAAREIAAMLDVASHRELPLGGLSQIGDSALLETGTPIGEAHSREASLPASFVPGRNALFLALAHALAQLVEARHVYAGVCQTDYSGYPDCRERFVGMQQAALNVGYEKDIVFHTPLMHLNKAQTWAVGGAIPGMLETLVHRTHTCYEGVRGDVAHAWGHGCGECPACLLRKRGWEEYALMPAATRRDAYKRALAACA